MNGSRWALLVSVVLLAGLSVISCTVHRAQAANPPAPAGTPAPPVLSGQWFVLDGGRLRQSSGPVDAAAGFEPWTEQSRVAGFLQMGERLYLAINGWGVIALDGDGNGTFRATPFEDRALFSGRTINGLFAEGGEVLLHLYRNTLFDTPAPQPPSISLVRLDPKSGRLTGVALPLSRRGWEAADVVQLPNGRWSIAWKKTEAHRIEFAYELYAPSSGKALRITSAAFLKTYDFQGIGRAPAPLRAVNSVIEHDASPGTVIDYVVRRPDLTWEERFREGSRRELLSGESSLLTVPVFQGEAYWALAGRRVIVSSNADAAQIFQLPALPGGCAYTDLWSDGRTLIVSWERQHFADVAAAGLFVASLPAR